MSKTENSGGSAVSVFDSTELTANQMLQASYDEADNEDQPDVDGETDDETEEDHLGGDTPQDDDYQAEDSDEDTVDSDKDDESDDKETDDTEDDDDQEEEGQGLPQNLSEILDDGFDEIIDATDGDTRNRIKQLRKGIRSALNPVLQSHTEYQSVLNNLSSDKIDVVQRQLEATINHVASHHGVSPEVLLKSFVGASSSDGEGDDEDSSSDILMTLEKVEDYPGYEDLSFDNQKLLRDTFKAVQSIKQSRLSDDDREYLKEQRQARQEAQKLNEARTTAKTKVKRLSREYSDTYGGFKLTEDMIAQAIVKHPQLSVEDAVQLDVGKMAVKHLQSNRDRRSRLKTGLGKPGTASVKKNRQAISALDAGPMNTSFFRMDD